MLLLSAFGSPSPSLDSRPHVVRCKQCRNVSLLQRPDLDRRIMQLHHDFVEVRRSLSHVIHVEACHLSSLPEGLAPGHPLHVPRPEAPDP